MDFQSVNPLNIRMNLLSGNLLPMTARDSPFPLYWKIYSAIVWMIHLILMIVLIIGYMYVSTEKILKDGLVCFAVSSEMLFMILRFYTYKDLIRQLIQQLNDILHHVRDEAVKNIVITTIKPIETPLNLYCIVGVASIIGWGLLPYILTYGNSLFYYEDFKLPIAFSKQPFSFSTFVLGNTFYTIGVIYVFIKKISVDIYMMHLILLTTSQYRYIAGKIATVFQKEYEHSAYQNRRKERDLKDLCRHHNAMVHLTLLLKRLLSLNFSIIYMSCVFRYSTLMIAIIMSPPWEKIPFIMFGSGAVVQLYILCSCVQQLLDASTEMTDKAFHEDWYVFKSSMKSTFSLIIMANNLDCKLATFENFNLSLSSFMTILNQAYSVSLLFLRVK